MHAPVDGLDAVEEQVEQLLAAEAPLGDGSRLLTVNLSQPISALARTVGGILHAAPIFRFGETLSTVDESGRIAGMTAERFTSWVESYLAFTRPVKDTPAVESIGKDLAGKIMAPADRERAARRVRTFGFTQLGIASVSLLAQLVLFGIGFYDGLKGHLAGRTRLLVTNALQYLQKVGDYSEPGAFFISKDGLATFRDRATLQAYTSGISFGSAGIPFVDFAVVYGIEEMVNSIAVTYTAGTVVAGTATANGTASQAKYGVIDSTVETLLAAAADVDGQKIQLDIRDSSGRR